MGSNELEVRKLSENFVSFFLELRRGNEREGGGGKQRGKKRRHVRLGPISTWWRTVVPRDFCQLLPSRNRGEGRVGRVVPNAYGREHSIPGDIVRP